MQRKLTMFARVLGLTLACAAGSAHAYRSWLLPSSTFVDDKDAYVTVDGAVSEQLFEFDHMPLRLDALRITGPDGAARQPENFVTGKRRTVFDLRLAQPGTYKLTLVSRTVMATYKLGGEEKRWRGAEDAMARELPAGAQDVVVSRSLTRLETFVTAVKPDFGVFKTDGEGIEMVPVTHPNELRAGEPVRLRFLIDGKPAAGLALSLVPGGVKYRGAIGEQRYQADANGEVAFTPAEAGRYWLNMAFPAAAPGQERVAPPARRLGYSATLEVLPQ